MWKWKLFLLTIQTIESSSDGSLQLEIISQISRNYFLMKDSMMHKKYMYISQIGEKNVWIKNLDFQKFHSANMSKSRRWIQAHDLPFTSLILQPLGYDYIQQNGFIDTNNLTTHKNHHLEKYDS